MRGLAILAALATTLVHAAMNDYIEERTLTLPGNGIHTLDVDAGPGALTIEGSDTESDISVEATIVVPDEDEVDARQTIESDVTLELTRDGDRARLRSAVESGGMFSWGEQPRVDLLVRMPSSLALRLTDGSGSLAVSGVSGGASIEDGSGSASLTGLGGDLSVHDGSGSLIIENVAGNVSIIDGSGSIRVKGVAGTVEIDDGSGSIDVRDVDADLVIHSAGSGGVRYSDIRGAVDYDEDN